MAVSFLKEQNYAELGSDLKARGQMEASATDELPEYEPTCYLCPGNKRAQGGTNPNYDSTYVFVNDYSAVKEVQPEYEQPADDG